MGVDVCTGSVEWIDSSWEFTFIPVVLTNYTPQFTHVYGSRVES